MALLDAVVFPQGDQRGPCCGSCGMTCVLTGYGVGGDELIEGVKMGSVMAQDGEDLVAAAATPHARSAAWPAAVVGTAPTWAGTTVQPTTTQPPSSARKRLRRRQRRTASTTVPRKEARNAETQRLNHIVVERNRRRQMNQHLATLRALMPRSYARRGDQASIVGGAVNFVKELEHRLQSLLHSEKRRRHRYAAAAADDRHHAEPSAGFFTVPQYSVVSAAAPDVAGSSSRRPGVADVEAAVSDGHATVKVLAPWRPGRKLLLRLLLGMQRRHGLAALHLNVATTPARMAVFYSITLRMGDGCQLSSAGDVAAVVHDIVAEANAAKECSTRACQNN